MRDEQQRVGEQMKQETRGTAETMVVKDERDEPFPSEMREWACMAGGRRSLDTCRLVLVHV